MTPEEEWEMDYSPDPEGKLGMIQNACLPVLQQLRDYCHKLEQQNESFKAALEDSIKTSRMATDLAGEAVNDVTLSNALLDEYDIPRQGKLPDRIRALLEKIHGNKRKNQ